MVVESRTVEANGLRFGLLEAGSGPLVLLLHGFPDDPWTWSKQIPALAAAGFRVVAPFMRGYLPATRPADGRYDADALGADVIELIRALGGSPARVVGHDWGAVATYAAACQAPEAIDSVAVLAVGHPSTFASLPLSPPHAHHAFHTWLFQLEHLRELVTRANDFALVDYLWRLWSPGHDDREHVERVKRETLDAPGVLDATLRYYPALVDLPSQRPDFVERFTRDTSTPTLSIYGGNDPAHTLTEGEHAHFSGPYRREVVEGAGHFVHRERPERVNDLLVEWLAHAPAARAAA
jgi:pimeloyl-ACP methyl ester carboxylesterase